MSEIRHKIMMDIQLLERRCREAGLHITARAVNHVTQAIGWEIAGDLTRADMGTRGERPEPKRRRT